MRKVLVLAMILFAVNATAQTWTINGQWMRWAGRMGIPVKDTTNANNVADSAQLVLRPADSTIYFKYKGYWRALAGGSTIDSLVYSTRAWRQKGLDSLAAISTLQKAISTGATLTQNNTIDGGDYNLTFNFDTLKFNNNVVTIDKMPASASTDSLVGWDATNKSLKRYSPNRVNSLNTLATVTANGNSTTDSVNIVTTGLQRLAQIYGRVIGGPFMAGEIKLNNTQNSNYARFNNGGLAFNNGSFEGVISVNNTFTAVRTIDLPDATGTLPLSVNSQTANSSGAITLTAANVGALGTADSLTAIRSNFTSIGRAYKIADSLASVINAGYLRLTGGTLTGALTGTTASFSGAINSNTLTASRIPYIGTNGTLRTNSLLAYDSATGRILVGTTTSRSVGGADRSFQIEGNATLLPAISIVRNSADAGGPTFYFGKSRNASVGGNTIVQNADVLGFIGFVGSDGSNMTSIGAALAAVVNGTPAGSFIPAQLEFRTTSSGSTPTTRMTIASAGNIGIGTTTPDASALQDMTSTTRGLLIPRMTTAQWDAISSKAQGLEAFDVTQQKPMFVGTASGITQWVNGTVFTQTNTVTVSNTTTESTVLGTGIGTKTIPANFLTAGKTIRLTVRGYMNETSTPTIRVRLKVGSVTVFDSNPVTINALGGTDKYFDAIFDITCRTTGTTGTVMPQGRWLYTANSGQTSIINGAVTATSTINTTISNALDLTVEWGTANASNNVNATNCSIEIIN